MNKKQAALSAMSHFGYYVSKTPPFSRQLKSLLDKLGIDLILDVGAHHGGYCSFLRGHVGYRGQIVSFEPCAESYGIVSQRMASDKQWRGFNFDLSETDTEATLNTFGGRGEFNSMLPLRQQVASAAYGVQERPKSETIQLARLESV